MLMLYRYCWQSQQISAATGSSSTSTPTEALVLARGTLSLPHRSCRAKALDAPEATCGLRFKQKIKIEKEREREREAKERETERVGCWPQASKQGLDVYRDMLRCYFPFRV